MESLRERLSANYSKHYLRVNTSLDASQISAKRKKDFHANFDNIIRSLPHQSKVLDLGCGAGLFINLLSEYDNIIVYGVDISEEQVKLARENNPNVQIICDDALNYISKYRDEFSAIFLIDLIEHLPTLDICYELLKKCHNALKKNGFIYLRTPNAANLTGNYSRYMDLTHERIFTSKSILQLLETSGYTNCKIIPIKSGHLTGRIRLIAEHILHHAIFLTCGRALENCFTSNVCAIGYKCD